MTQDSRSTPAEQSPRSFLARFGAIIARDGIASIPQALFRYQAELGLSAQQTWFVSAVLSFKWDEDLPYPSLHKIADRSGISRQQLHRYERELIDKGYLAVVNRFVPNGGQTSNAWDFGPLFARLEDLLRRDRVGSDPSNTGVTGGSNAGAPGPVTPVLHEEEPRKKKQGRESGSRHVDRAAPSVSDEDRDIISQYVDDFRRDLGDGSGQARALGQVLSLYARCAETVTTERFIDEMQDARQAAKGHSARNRWAYFYRVLEDRLRGGTE